MVVSFERLKADFKTWVKFKTMATSASFDTLVL